MSIPLQPMVADFDADGDLDIALTNGFLRLQPPTVAILENDGRGAFTPGGRSIDSPGNPFTLARCSRLVDTDGDSFAELVIVFSDGRIEIYPNANGSFGAPLVYRPPFPNPSSTGPRTYWSNTILAADLDRDGNPEILVPFTRCELFSAPAGAGTAILNFGGTRTILHARHSALPGGRIAALKAADMDLDGRMDLVAVDDQGTLTITRGNGLGGFLNTLAIPLAGQGGIAGTLALGDLDGDGDTDAVLGSNTTAHIDVVENLAGASFRPRSMVPASGCSGICSLHLRDFDGDGDTDLLTLEAFDASGRGTLRLYDNDGAGAFSPSGGVPAGALHTCSADAIDLLAVGDFDGNATPDVALSCFRSSSAAPPALGIFRSRAQPPYEVRLEGRGTPGHNGLVPRIAIGGGPAVRNNPFFQIQLEGGLPFARAVLFTGRETQLSPLSPRIRLLLVPLQLAIVDLDARGRHSWRTPIPDDPMVCGAWGYAQAWLGDPAANPCGLSATARLAVLVGERY